MRLMLCIDGMCFRSSEFIRDYLLDPYTIANKFAPTGEDILIRGWP